MRLVHTMDIGAPADFVFARLTDFDTLSRQAMRKGAQVERLDQHEGTGVGTSWTARFNYRGRDREMASVVTEFDRPSGFAITSQVGGIDSVMVVDLVPLSPGQTRVAMAVEMAATTMTARLLLQSLKLARTTLSKRLADRMTRFGKDVETAYDATLSG